MKGIEPSRVDEANALYRQGRLADAERAFQAILREDAGSFDACHRIGAIRVAEGRLAEAVEYLQRALERNPDSSTARYNLGIALAALKRTDEAIDSYRKAIELDPELAEAHSNLATLLEAGGSRDEAIASYRRALAIRPDLTEANHNLIHLLHRSGRRGEVADHYRQWLEAAADCDEPRYVYGALTGAVSPHRMPDVLVEREFDRAAATFDLQAHAAGNRGPSLVARALRLARGGPRARSDILDAGCGTGRCGERVKPWARRLTGVDLSTRMLERARATGVYDGLVRSEVGAYLQSCPGAFDVIVASDVIPYFGPLDALLASARAALRADGLLVFTADRAFESRTPDGYRLEPQGRFGHTRDYLRRTLERSGFGVLSIDASTLRAELQRPVTGFVATCERVEGRGCGARARTRAHALRMLVRKLGARRAPGA